MNTNIKDIAFFVATAIWADEVYDEAEKESLSNIADALEINEDEFIKDVEEILNDIKDKEEDYVNNKLVEVGKNIASEEKWIIFEALLEIILADNKLTKEEVSNLLAMAEALNLETEQAILLLADMVKNEEDMEIEIEF